VKDEVTAAQVNAFFQGYADAYSRADADESALSGTILPSCPTMDGIKALAALPDNELRAWRERGTPLGA
jgi:hypothetical protein